MLVRHISLTKNENSCALQRFIFEMLPKVFYREIMYASPHSHELSSFHLMGDLPEQDWS